MYITILTAYPSILVEVTSLLIRWVIYASIYASFVRVKYMETDIS